MILTRFTVALAALGAWCALATAAAAPAFELPGVPAQARDSVGALFQTLDGSPASTPRVDADAVTMVPVTLAQLEDQLRRPDVRASIGKGTIAVLYSNVDQPFRTAFTSVIRGIQEGTSLPVRSYAVEARADPIDLNAMLRRNGTRIVIALGRQGLAAAAGLDRDISVLVGGVLLLSDSDNLAGISLTPDPAMLFARLRELLPELRRVIVVYNPKNSEWLIRLAREAARAQGLELAAFVAGDMARAVQLYPQLIATADGRRDAVWLPHDATTVEEGTILPLVLRETGNGGVPLFSSNVLHEKKGALFAMVPNNVEMGRTLASSALSMLSGGARARSLAPSRTLQTAIDLRTASHVGVQLGERRQRGFDFVFPQP
ncbi:ABC transporter substrate-binding protein [Pseudoduganella buxea]|uniref:ABC transporter substrate-binding protein n=1 Tax=Pseudoduganella buxea TaxID=1949069 RepID=A0A6I3T5P7_9BURK|nr:ABC transporter substrate binding protein [Pseudoduganella buxea]MTV56245.1 hypothetical protein [Pseudoduganella buxea]GGB99622.1 hypothetical protein GCM10011572_21950 [Pseudoduganella buxea]